MADAPASPKLLNLALQGGGSHGAFAWGVLDRLLEDPRVEIEAITGVSAGAMNAVALAPGYPRDAWWLREFWDDVLHEARTSPLRRTPLEAMLGGWNLDPSPAYVMLDLLTRIASPYDFSPFNLNPLKDLIVELVVFDCVRKSKVKVFISATNVETGRTEVWEKKELTGRPCDGLGLPALVVPGLKHCIIT